MFIKTGNKFTDRNRVIDLPNCQTHAFLVELTHEMDTDDEKISSIPFLEFIHLNRMF